MRYPLTALLLGISILTSARAAEPLRFRLASEPSTLDWNLARTSDETYVIMNLMEGLVEEGPDLKPRPALAERWEISTDGKTYTFHLRSGVSWSDGKPLKAQDFEDSWIRLLDPKTHASYASYLFDIENAESFHAGKLKDAKQVGVKALGERVLQVKLRQVVPYFLHIPTFWVTFPIRKDLVQKNGIAWAVPGKIVTLGPYKLESWKRGQSLTLARNASYFAASAAPLVEKAEAIVETDDRKARALFEAGKLDFLLDATTEDFVRFNSAKAPASGGPAGKIKAAQFPYLATFYLGFNSRSPALKEASLRRALALAVNRDQLPAVLQGGQTPAPCWIPPGMDGHHPESSSSGPHLVGTIYDAKGALAKAGYPEGRGFPRLKLRVQRFDGAEAVARALAASLKQNLGIEIDSQVGKVDDQADLFVAHWGADYPDPANFYEVFDSKSGTNYTHWSDAAYDDLLARARGTLEMSIRLAAYAEAEKLLVDKHAAIAPLFYKKNIALLGPRVKEMRISPLNYLFFKEIRLAP